nr:MAG: hypothetical protein DIU64_09695 [Caldicoprobacter oshimai]
MTNDELNDFIDRIAEAYTTSTKSSKLVSTNSTTLVQKGYDPLQLAWLAAAQIARNKGYTCSATLVEYSVRDVPYSEGFGVSGPFTAKIRPTPVYKNYLARLKAGTITKNPWPLIFTKADNPDLFYSLHKVDVYATGYMVGTPFASYIVTISDTFDFDLDDNYMDDLFTTLVNNWAWLCQQTHVLHPIPVRITIME